MIETKKVDDCWAIDLVETLPLMHLSICKSKVQAKRLLKQGAVEVNGEKVTDRHITAANGDILHIGKLFWRKLVLPIITLDIWEDENNHYAKVVDIK